MSKSPLVNYYRHRKNKHRQVITYEQPDGTLKVTVVDWEKGKVTSFEEEEKKESPQNSS